MTSVELTGPQSSIKLSSGHSIPRLGLGVYQSEEGQEAENAVLWALQVPPPPLDPFFSLLLTLLSFLPPFTVHKCKANERRVLNTTNVSLTSFYFAFFFCL